jgi:uncharacterized MAPEG superfamily protein
MSVLNFILRFTVPLSLILAFEELFLRSSVPYLYESSLLGFERAFGLVIFLNVVVAAYTVISISFAVSKAREVAKEEALADEICCFWPFLFDPHREERYSYPKAYAEGFSRHAKKFNCAQRAHQQTMETYPTFVFCSLVGAMAFPVTTALAGFVWSYSRQVWSKGYQSGNPSHRYSHWTAFHIWTSLLAVIFAAAVTSVKFFL